VATPEATDAGRFSHFLRPAVIETHLRPTAFLRPRRDRGGIEQGETVVAARSRYTYGLPRSSTRVCHACWGVLQRGPEKLITDGYRAIFECVVRGFVVTRRIQEDIGPWLIMTIVRHRRHRAGWSARGHRAAPPLPQQAVAESDRSFRP
jgi:hypothetical protein